MLRQTVRRLFHASFRFSTTPQLVFVEDESLPEEGYEIVISALGVVVSSRFAIGALYAVYTLEQLYDSPTRSLPCGRIVDAPKLSLRGVMIDISRNKIPRLTTLKRLLPILSRLRINHLELYVEGFSMESRTFPDVDTRHRPFRIDEYQTFERIAHEFGIELVGNQNSFGHMTAWLKRPEFHRLAECEDGFIQWGYPFPASTMNPTDPESIVFIKRMLDGFLPYTKAERFNINCDEPFELGRGKSQTAVEAKGVGAVYWQFVEQIIRHLRTHNKKAMLWGDVLIHHPELLDQIPEDALFLDWGYERDYPFDDHARMLHQHTVAFATCPGTSSWNSFSGRYEDMMKSTLNAVQAAILHQGIGTITTDWGDFGHLQYLPTSYYGFAVLGGAAWNGRINERDLEHYLNRFVYRDSAYRTAKAFRLLAQTQNDEPAYVPNATVLFRSIQFVDVEDRPIELKTAVLRQALRALPIDDRACLAIRKRLSHVKRRINQIRIAGEEGALIQAELRQTISHLEMALDVNRCFTSADISEVERIRISLRRRLPKIIEQHRRLWLKRNLSTTLDESVKRFEVLGQILAQNPPL
ncbi:MAG: beta-N-acetylhexosaminidase [Bacillus subtilis]|nr:beta-N-acetylhexosaminidase [Bacillus subtilis]